MPIKQGESVVLTYLAVHGNTQNGQTAREDWKPVFAGNKQWQIATKMDMERIDEL